MVKENGTITTNYLGENTTEEHNGLLVSVPMNSTDIDKAKESLVSLAFFPNIYVDFKTDYSTDNNINDAKIVRYNTFSVCDKLRQSNHKYEVKKLWILLGNVLYPLDISKIPCDIDYSILDNLKECNICVNVNIGEINVTPNREEIIYSENTIKIISNKLKAVIQEIGDNITKLSSHDITDLREYYNIVCSRSYWNPIRNCIENSYIGNYKCTLNNSYKGIKRNEDFNNVVKTLDCIVPGFKSIRYGYGFKSNKSINWYNRTACSSLSKSFIAFEDDRNLSGYAKRYINSKGEFQAIPIISITKYPEFEKEIISRTQYSSDYYTHTVPDEAIYAVKEAYDYIQNNTRIITVKEINEFKDKCKLEDGPRDKFKDNSLYTLFKFVEISYNCPRSIKVDSEIKFDVVINKLKKGGKLILHNGKNILSEQQATEYNLLRNLGYNIYWTSNKLYNNIVKYKSRLPKNSRTLSNVILNYSNIINNPNPNIECAIVLSKFCKDKFYFNKVEEYYSDWLTKECYILLNNKDLFNKYYRCMIENRTNLNRIYFSKIYDTYTVKSHEALWLKQYLENIKLIIFKYYEYYSKVGTEFSAIRNKATLGKYFTMKWCIKNKIPFDINSFIDINKNSLIKLLYEQTY